LYRICTRSAGHLASRSDDTIRFSHGAPFVFEAQPLYRGAVTATPKNPDLVAEQLIWCVGAATLSASVHDACGRTEFITLRQSHDELAYVLSVEAGERWYVHSVRILEVAQASFLAVVGSSHRSLIA
jgi:hypothetical protein